MRDIAVYAVMGVVGYASLAGIVALIAWWLRITDPSDDDPVAPRFAFTVDLGDGATVLSLLATLMIALHVVAWQIKPSGPLANLAHARRRLLGQVAGPLGFIAMTTGAATLLHGAPDRSASVSSPWRSLPSSSPCSRSTCNPF
ncbi:hypothetical protein ACWFRB_00140 [Rhodococcus sp. NPDC055112]